jgi:hypothetical protein
MTGAADLVISTSSGATAATHVRSGIPPAQLLASILSEPVPPVGQNRQRPPSAPQPPRLSIYAVRWAGSRSGYGDFRVRATLHKKEQRPCCFGSLLLLQIKNRRLYFSLLGGAIPFNRRYSASVAYCSVSCCEVPHINPIRYRFPRPRSTISSAFASVNDANALSHSANEAFNASTIAALSAVSAGVFTRASGGV